MERFGKGTWAGSGTVISLELAVVSVSAGTMVREWSVSHAIPGPRCRGFRTYCHNRQWPCSFSIAHEVPKPPYFEMRRLHGDLIQAFLRGALAGVHSIYMTHDSLTIRCYCWGSEDEPFCGEGSKAQSGSIEASFGSGVVSRTYVSSMIKCLQMILCSLNGILSTCQSRRP